MEELKLASDSSYFKTHYFESIRHMILIFFLKPIFALEGVFAQGDTEGKLQDMICYSDLIYEFLKNLTQP